MLTVFMSVLRVHSGRPSEGPATYPGIVSRTCLCRQRPRRGHGDARALAPLPLLRERPHASHTRARCESVQQRAAGAGHSLGRNYGKKSKRTTSRPCDILRALCPATSELRIYHMNGIIWFTTAQFFNGDRGQLFVGLLTVLMA